MRCNIDGFDMRKKKLIKEREKIYWALSYASFASRAAGLNK